MPREAIEQKLVEQKKRENSKKVKESDPNVSISNASQSEVAQTLDSYANTPISQKTPVGGLVATSRKNNQLDFTL